MALINSTWKVTHDDVILLAFSDFTDGEPQIQRAFINDRVAILGADTGINIGRGNLSHTISFRRFKYFDNDDEARSYMREHTNALSVLPADCVIEWLNLGVTDTISNTAIISYSARVENNFFIGDYTLLGGDIAGSITPPPPPSGFTYYSDVTIDHTKVPSDLTDFPVLISLTDARFKSVANGGHVQSSSGYDIQPFPPLFSETSPPLDYELESYDPTTGTILMWVKEPLLHSDADTTIVLVYGNTALTTDGSTTATWSNSFLGVYHLGDGTTLDVNSATGSHNGTNHSATATTGKIDGAADFASASSQYIDLGTGIGPGALTYSAWVKGTFPNSYQTILCKDGGGALSRVYVKSTGKLAASVIATPTLSYDGTGAITLSESTWYHVALTSNAASGLSVYVNGALDKNVPGDGSLNTSSNATQIGSDQGAGGRYWNGTIDEARIANVARSADWITTEYNNQSSPGTFETLGTERS